MASFTPIYNMAYFDFGDKLDASINIQREAERFIFIDKMMYALYLIYGNGVINGWEVTDGGFTSANGISLSISSGNGIINYVACVSNTPQIINNLQPNSTLYIFAVGTPNVLVDMSVNFIASTSQSVSGGVLLCTIITGINGIVSISNLTRDFLNFEQEIQTAINNHKHRGIPTKIDLSSEVKNQLPGAHLENFDANKVTTGKFDNSIIPSLNHSELLNIGILSHAQLDSLSQIITADNSSLLGEVTTTNFLKQIIFEKYQYSNIDQYFINELCIIPGISDSLIDYQNTTANVDYIDHYFSGINIGGAISYIFTNNITLTSPIIKGILTSTKILPTNGQIIYGINTTNSVNFNDYTTITEDKLYALTTTGQNARIGVKLVTPITVNPPSTNYDNINNFTDFINFQFQNLSAFTTNFHFKIDFYTDVLKTNLYTSKFSLNDQNGWIVNGTDSVPTAGYSVDSNATIDIAYFVNQADFVYGTTYYITISVYDGTSFTTSDESLSPDIFIISGNNTPAAIDSGVPIVRDFATMFSLNNGDMIPFNL